MYRARYGVTRSVGFLSEGWTCCFLDRHPGLSIRSAQVIQRARNEVTIVMLQHFYYSYLWYIIEQAVTPQRLFNMDETVFAQKNKSRKVIAARESRNVWSKIAHSNFHLTIIACCAANGFVVPPLYVVLDDRLHRTVLDQCADASSAITTAPRGFINEKVFLLWLQHFDAKIPSNVHRPVVLVYDGCRSHLSAATSVKAVALKIILVQLPANATYLLQPLDVVVLKPFKVALQKKVLDVMTAGRDATISNPDAIRFASEAWVSSVHERSDIVAGFRACGMWPVSYPQQARHLQLFKDGGMQNKLVAPAWLKIK